MKATILCSSLALILCGTGVTSRAEAPPTSGKNVSAKKSQFNSQVFEKDNSSTASFSAQTKVIREVQGESQVFFEGQNGLFVLNLAGSNAGRCQNLLTASQVKKFKVQVSYDPDSRQILDVQRADETP